MKPNTVLLQSFYGLGVWCVQHTLLLTNLGMIIQYTATVLVRCEWHDCLKEKVGEGNEE